MKLEDVILSNLAFNEDYSRKVIPFLRDDYFMNIEDKLLYGIIDKYIKSYNSMPTKEALFIELNDMDNIHEGTFNAVQSKIQAITNDYVNKDTIWLLNKTEQFCKDRAIHNVFLTGIDIIKNRNTPYSREVLPKLMQEALAVSFDTHIGHDFIEDASDRWSKYVEVSERIPFDLEYLNWITRGGLPKKTLNVILAGTGVGKSMFMCHCAAANLLLGKRVLYITLEMAEEEIAKRIDANLLDIPIKELDTIPKKIFEDKIARLRGKGVGQLIIKEYPTATASAANFRHLLDELRIKRNFIPDIIYIDYINICISARFKSGSNVGSYTIIKAIAEELRGLAVEYNVPIMSATQLNRSGFANSDPGLEDTSESFGLPQTVDLMFALISNDELEQMGQILVKQLKNRYNDMAFYKKFFVGVDKSKMRFYDVDQNSEDDPNKIDTPIIDRSSVGERINNENGGRNRRLLDDFT